MLYPTAGSRLYIANAPVETPGALPASGWIEIGEAEAIGMVGSQWDTEEAVYVDCEEGNPQLEPVKSLERRPAWQIILGNDPEDTGQAILWSASRSRAHYPFRLVFPGGAHWRGWFGLVTGLFEVFDTANSIMKLQADVLPTSKTFRSEDA